MGTKVVMAVNCGLRFYRLASPPAAFLDSDRPIGSLPNNWPSRVAGLVLELLHVWVLSVATGEDRLAWIRELDGVLQRPPRGEPEHPT